MRACVHGRIRVQGHVYVRLCASAFVHACTHACLCDACDACVCSKVCACVFVRVGLKLSLNHLVPLALGSVAKSVCVFVCVCFLACGLPSRTSVKVSRRTNVEWIVSLRTEYQQAHAFKQPAIQP